MEQQEVEFVSKLFPTDLPLQLVSVRRWQRSSLCRCYLQRCVNLMRSLKLCLFIRDKKKEDKEKKRSKTPPKSYSTARRSRSASR